LRTFTYKKTDKLLRTHTEEPRRIQFARETTLKVVSEQDKNASLLAPANLTSKLVEIDQNEHQIMS
jgi:hypothetical protein